MSQAISAIKSARAYLNDVNGISWSDSILMPLLQEAYGELVQDLDVNQAGVLKQRTSPILVPAGVVLLPSQPTNILEPIFMMERQPGTSSDFFMDMIKVNFLPEVDMDANLVFWSWSQEEVQFVGATTDREVILQYKGYPPTPQVLTDPIGIIYAERYLGPRIAALAYDSINRNSKQLNEIAQTNKYKIIQRNVLVEQTPVRRRGYRSSKGFFRGTSVPISISGGANPDVPTNFPVTSAINLATNFAGTLLTNQGRPRAGLYNVILYETANAEGTGSVTITVGWFDGVTPHSTVFTYNLGDSTQRNSLDEPLYTDGSQDVTINVAYTATGSYSLWARLSQ